MATQMNLFYAASVDARSAEKLKDQARISAWAYDWYLGHKTPVFGNSGTFYAKKIIHTELELETIYDALSTITEQTRGDIQLIVIYTANPETKSIILRMMDRKNEMTRKTPQHPRVSLFDEALFKKVQSELYRVKDLLQEVNIKKISSSDKRYQKCKQTAQRIRRGAMEIL